MLYAVNGEYLDMLSQKNMDLALVMFSEGMPESPGLSLDRLVSCCGDKI